MTTTSTIPEAPRSDDDEIADEVRALERRLETVQAQRAQPLADLVERRREAYGRFQSLQDRAAELTRAVTALDEQEQEVQLRPDLTALTSALPVALWLGGAIELLHRHHFAACAISSGVWAAAMLAARLRRGR